MTVMTNNDKFENDKSYENDEIGDKTGENVMMKLAKRKLVEMIKLVKGKRESGKQVVWSQTCICRFSVYTLCYGRPITMKSA